MSFAKYASRPLLLDITGKDWRGFCSVDELSRMGAVERKARRWGFCDSQESLCDILDNADKELFSKVLNQPHHSLHTLLPPIKTTGYNLRPRGHPYELPRKTALLAKNFISRMLYSIL